jgi:O-antigen ligase
VIARPVVDSRGALLAALLAFAALALTLLFGARGATHPVYLLALGLALLPVAAAIAVWVEPSAVVTLGLALTLFSGNWEHVGAPVAFDRVILLTGLAGIALRARTDPRYRPRLQPVHGVIAVAAVYAVGSAMWVGTLGERSALFTLLDRYALVGFVLFLVAPVAFRTEEQRTHLLAGLVAVGGYLGITACTQGLGLDQLVFPRFILDESIGHHVDRARGPFLEAGANGLAMFACAVASVIAAARWRGRWRQVAIGVCALCLLGILFTLTRQVWLGAVLGAVVGLAVTPRLRSHAVPLILAGFLVVLAAYSTAPGLRARVDSRANNERTVWDRLNSGRAALRMVADRPLLGFGWGMFERESVPYYAVARDYPLSHVRNLHNLILSNAVELGLVGLTLWAAALLAALAGALLRRGPPELEPWRYGLVALAVCWLVVVNFTPFGYTFTNYLLWMWAGLAAGTALPESPVPVAHEPRPRRPIRRRMPIARRGTRRQPVSSL